MACWGETRTWCCEWVVTWPVLLLFSLFSNFHSHGSTHTPFPRMSGVAGRIRLCSTAALLFGFLSRVFSHGPSFSAPYWHFCSFCWCPTSWKPSHILHTACPVKPWEHANGSWCDSRWSGRILCSRWCCKIYRRSSLHTFSVAFPVYGQGQCVATSQ